MTIFDLFRLSLRVAGRFNIKWKDAVIYFDMADVSELLAELTQAKTLPTYKRWRARPSAWMYKGKAVGGHHRKRPFWTQLYFKEDNGFQPF